MKPLLMVSMLSLFLSCVCATCYGQSSAQKSLVIAAFPSVDLIIKDALPAWYRLHPDVKVKLISREFGDHHSALTLAFATGSGIPDIMAVENGFMGRIANSGGLVDLMPPPYNGNQYQNKFTKFAYQQGISKNGQLTALPSDIGPGALFYRRDIISKAGLNEIDITQSWESYLRSARIIKQKTHSYIVAHARDIKDVIIRTNVPAGGSIYFNIDGTPAVDSARFEKAFRLAKAIRKEKLDGNLISWSNEWSEGLRRGTIATQMMGVWFGGHLENWLAPNTKGLWRTSYLPENSKVSWGGTFLAISKTSNQRDLAWEFIKLITLNKNIQVSSFKKYNAFPALIEALDDPFFYESSPFFDNQRPRLIWKSLAKEIPSISVNKFDAIAEEIINTELDKVLNKNKDIHASLIDAKNLLQKRIVR